MHIIAYNIYQFIHKCLFLIIIIYIILSFTEILLLLLFNSYLK